MDGEAAAAAAGAGAGAAAAAAGTISGRIGIGAAAAAAGAAASSACCCWGVPERELWGVAEGDSNSAVSASVWSGRASGRTTFSVSPGRSGRSG